MHADGIVVGIHTDHEQSDFAAVQRGDRRAELLQAFEQRALGAMIVAAVGRATFMMRPRAAAMIDPDLEITCLDRSRIGTAMTMALEFDRAPGLDGGIEIEHGSGIGATTGDHRLRDAQDVLGQPSQATIGTGHDVDGMEAETLDQRLDRLAFVLAEKLADPASTHEFDEACKHAMGIDPAPGQRPGPAKLLRRVAELQPVVTRQAGKSMAELTALGSLGSQMLQILLDPCKSPFQRLPTFIESTLESHFGKWMRPDTALVRVWHAVESLAPARARRRVDHGPGLSLDRVDPGARLATIVAETCAARRDHGLALSPTGKGDLGGGLG
jgi:hypothetical protein